MKLKAIKKDIFMVGAVDWDRRLFDALIPLPDGTSYNAYLVKGSEKTILVDTVDPALTHILLDNLSEVPELDYIIAQHAEQDHSGSLPALLEKYPGAKILTSDKGKSMLQDLMDIKEEKFKVVADGEEISAGDKTLKFIYTPWVHWPETMCTYLKEEELLFTCDFFGSHLATTDVFVTNEHRVYEAAKRYYSEIMMPFRKIIRKNMEKLKDYKISMIAPSHGPVYQNPDFILAAYKDWISDEVKNLVILPYVSMHGSTAAMVEYLNRALSAKGIEVRQFDLTTVDLGKLAISLVDAATLIIAAPTVHTAPHPLAQYAANLTNALRPKVKWAGVIGSYGWKSKAPEIIFDLLPQLKVESCGPVLVRGLPREETYQKLEELADQIAAGHKSLGL